MPNKKLLIWSTSTLVLLSGIFNTTYPSSLDYIYEQEIIQSCQSELEENPILFRQKLRIKIQEILNNDISRNINNLINFYWDKYQLPKIYNAIIKEKIEKVVRNTSLWERIKGSFSSSEIKKLSEQIIRKTFADIRMKNTLNILIQSVSNNITQRLEKKIKQLQDLSLQCIRVALSNINPVLHKLVNLSLQKSKEEGLKNFKSRISPSTTFPYWSGAGVSLIILRKQITNIIMKRLGKTLASRIIGQVLKRVVSRVIPVIGILLTAKDIVNIASGNELKETLTSALTSEEAVDSIKKQLINGMTLQFNKEIESIANDLSRKFYIAVKTTINKLDKYNELVQDDLLLQQRLDQILQQGDSEKAQKLLDLAYYVKRLGLYDHFQTIISNEEKLDALISIYPQMLPVLNYTKSLDTVYEWFVLVGKDKQKFQKLVDLEIYKYLKPSDIDSSVLDYLLKFDKYATVKYLLSVVNLKDLRKITHIEPIYIENILENYGAKGVKCIVDYLKINPTLASKIAKITVEKEKIFYFLCKEEIKNYLSQNPNDLDAIVDIYESKNSIFGKAKLILGQFIGIYPSEIIRDISPFLYYIGLSFRLILVVVLLGAIYRLILMFKRVTFTFRGGKEKIIQSSKHQNSKYQQINRNQNSKNSNFTQKN